MRKNLYNHGAATIASVSPIGAGGSSATDQQQALENLGGIPPGSPMLITLDDKAKVNKSLFGTAVAPTPTIDGIYDVASNTNYTYTITNFDKDVSYNLSQVVGGALVSFIRENIVIRTGNNLQANDQVGFTLNNKIVRLAPIPNGVNKPIILAPTNNATGLDEVMELRCSTFSNVGDPDTHDRTTWELATDPAFTTNVQTHVNAAFTYNITDRSLLAWSQVYYMRVKHWGTSGRYSDWSDTVKFTVMSEPPKPVFSIESAAALQTASVNEGDTGTTSVVLTIKRTGTYLGIASDAYWNISLLTTGSEDVQPVVNGTVNFASGVTSETISIAVVGDYNVESTETFNVVLTSDTNSTVNSSKSQVTVSITDNDIVPVVNVSSSVATIGEPLTGEVDVTFFINRTGNIKIASTVSWTVITTGTGYVSAADFGSSTQTFTGTSSFGVDETQKSVTFKLKADLDSENNEIVDFTISTPVGCSLGTITNVQVTVTKPIPIVGVSSVSPVSITEPLSGTTDVTFTITKTGAEACSVDWTLASGIGFISAADLASGQATSGTVNFIASDTSKTVVISVKSDTDFSEGAEVLKLQLSNPSSCTIDPANVFQNCTIYDSALPQLTIAVSATGETSPGVAFEPIDSTLLDVVFTVTKTGTGACSCTVTTHGTLDANDFNLTAATYNGTLGTFNVSFTASETSKTFKYGVKKDTSVETITEFLTLTLSNPIGATIDTGIGGGDVATVSITDRVVLPTVTISSPQTSWSEPATGQTNVTFNITKTGSGNCSVGWQIADLGGNPVNSSDFETGTATSGTLSFTTDPETKTITIPIIQDTLINGAESTETLSIQLLNTSNCTVLGPTSLTVDITNTVQATAPVYSIGPAGFGAGGMAYGEGSTFEFFVSRTVGTSAGSVTWTKTGTSAAGDFQAGTPTTGTINFAVGETIKNLSFVTVVDTDNEQDETLIVTLSGVTGGGTLGTSSFYTATIQNTTALSVVTLETNTSSLSEPASGTTTVTLTARRTGGLTSVCSIGWTSDIGAGNGFADLNDFSAAQSASGSFSFAANATTATQTFNIQQDNVTETSAESFTVTLNPTGTNCTASPTMKAVTVTITAESAYVPPVVQFRNNGPQYVLEGNSMFFYIDATGDRSRTSKVNLAIFALFGTVDTADFTNIPAMSAEIDLASTAATTLHFNLATNNDGNYNDESFMIAIGAPVNCTIATSDASTNYHTTQQVGVIQQAAPFNPSGSLYTDYTKNTPMAGHQFLTEAAAAFVPGIMQYMTKLAIKLSGFGGYQNTSNCYLEIHCPGGDIFNLPFTATGMASVYFRDQNLSPTTWSLINSKTMRSPTPISFDSSGNCNYDNLEIVLASRKDPGSYNMSGNHYCYFRVINSSGTVIYNGADSNNGGTAGGFIGPTAFFYNYAVSVSGGFDGGG